MVVVECPVEVGMQNIIWCDLYMIHNIYVCEEIASQDAVICCDGKLRGTYLNFDEG